MYRGRRWGGWSRSCHEHGAHGRADAREFWREAMRGGHDGALFGVRRPLRFMAHKLDLDENQVRVLARILDDLKLERAQARVDDQRTISAFAEAMDGEAFDEAVADTAADRRVESAKRLKSAVVKALKDTHGMLDERQRSRLAYMLRSGVLTI